MGPGRGTCTAGACSLAQGTALQGIARYAGSGVRSGAARRAWAYAGCLPDVLKEALGGDEELEQAAEPVSAVAGLQQPKHLAQDRGGRGFEGGVEGLEGTLHRRVQRPGVLREESVAGGRAAPQRDTVTPRSLCPPSHAALSHRASAGSLVPLRRRARGAPSLPGLTPGRNRA